MPINAYQHWDQLMSTAQQGVGTYKVLSNMKGLGKDIEDSTKENRKLLLMSGDNSEPKESVGGGPHKVDPGSNASSDGVEDLKGRFYPYIEGTGPDDWHLEYKPNDQVPPDWQVAPAKTAGFYQLKIAMAKGLSKTRFRQQQKKIIYNYFKNLNNKYKYSADDNKQGNHGGE